MYMLSNVIFARARGIIEGQPTENERGAVLSTPATRVTYWSYVTMTHCNRTPCMIPSEYFHPCRFAADVCVSEVR